MWIDVVDLRDFYASPLGRVARRVIGAHLRALWPDVTAQAILGLGYATPYLNYFRGEAERVIAAMPARQGVVRWPSDGPGLTVLCDEADLPLPDLCVDRVILIHALEFSEQIRPLLREAWRVLNEGGRLLVVTPNRRGIWARLERTPFGHGQPYSARQLSQVLRENMFTPIRTRSGLFVPPSRSRMVLSSARVFEGVGQRFFNAFSGVLAMEASKEIYAGQLETESRRRRTLVTVPGGNTRSVPHTRSAPPAVEITRRR